MSDKQLKPDQEAVDAWEQMPKNAPSRDALPPMTGGFPGWLVILIAVTLVIIVLSLLFQS